MPNPPPGPPGPPGSTPPRRPPSNLPPAIPLPRPLPRAAAPPPPPQVPTVACPFCNQVMQAPPQMAGQLVNCPHCQGQIQLPGPAMPGQQVYAPPPSNPYGDQYGAAPGGFPTMQGSQNAPLQFNSGPSPRRSSSSSYKRKKQTGIIPILMMIATAIWLLAMPVVYLYITGSVEAEIARNPNKVVMTRRGPVTAAQARELSGIAGIYGALCCPTTFYAVAMVILLIAMAVSSSSERRE